MRLHTNVQGDEVSDKKIFSCFPYISLCEICDPVVQVMNADIPIKVLKTRRVSI